MNNPRALLIDDEPLLCEFLHRSLEQLWPQLVITGVATNGGEALAMIHEQEPDIIFLDIRMPGLDGLSVARQLALFDSPPLIVFVTAYDQYAVDAFEQEAVDYLLKPVEDMRMQKCIHRLKARLDARNEQQSESTQVQALATLMDRLGAQHKPQKLAWIKAMRQENIYLISPDDVCYFQAEDKYTTVVTEGDEYVIRTPIKELKEQLDENLFVQIRRGTLVNSKYIEKIQRDFAGRMHVHLKGAPERLQISRSFGATFKQM